MFGLLFFVPLLGMAVGVPTNTVKTYVRSIYNKLGISSRRTAVLAGYENGLIATTPRRDRVPGHAVRLTPVRPRATSGRGDPQSFVSGEATTGHPADPGPGRTIRRGSTR
jgi:hypothetical protein